jgi:hypothetical protein
VKLGELAQILDTQIVIRYPDDGGQWYADMDHVEVMENGCLVSPCGRGGTPEAAVFRYANEIAGKRIAIHAGTKDRREANVPAALEAL